jgi:hypothetical protein
MLLFALLHQCKVGQTVGASTDFHGLALLHALAFIKRKLLSNFDAIIQWIEAFLLNLSNDGLNIGPNVRLASVPLPVHLVKDQILPPLQLLDSPSHILLEHLAEHQRVKDDVIEDDWCPPNRLLLCKRHVSEDQHDVY